MSPALPSSSPSSSRASLASVPSREDGPGQQQQTQWRSVYFITFICVMDAMRISTVLGNSWPYLSSVDPAINEEFFGLSKSAFTLGAIVSALLSGWLSNRISNTKPPILAGLLTSSLACFFFANLELIPRNRRYGFLIAEILFGVATGAIQTWRVSIAMSSTDGDRAKATSMCGFAINLGFVLGPLVVLSLGWLLSKRSLQMPWGTHLSIFTAPIYLMAFLSLAGALLLLLCFDGRMRLGRTRVAGDAWAAQDQLEKTPLELSVPTEDPVRPPPCEGAKSRSPPSSSSSARFNFQAILACFVARFCFMFFILYLMALSAPYAMTVFGWTGEQMVFYQMLTQGTMGLMGILVCLGYTLRLLSRFKERFCVLAAMSLMLAFFLASFPWPFLSARLPEPTYRNETGVNGSVVPKLVAHGCDPDKYKWCQSTPAINVFVYHAALILCLGLAMPVGQINLDVLYSRLLGQIKQGTMQGLFVAVGDMVSLCGPLIITVVYQQNGPGTVWIGQICIFALSIAFWLFCYQKLLPSSYQPVPLEEKGSAEEWTNEKRRRAKEGEGEGEGLANGSEVAQTEAIS